MTENEKCGQFFCQGPSFTKKGAAILNRGGDYKKHKSSHEEEGGSMAAWHQLISSIALLNFWTFYRKIWRFAPEAIFLFFVFCQP